MGSIEFENVDVSFPSARIPSMKEWIVRKATGRGHIDWFPALTDVSFSVDTGECLGVVGANGAGKRYLAVSAAHITHMLRDTFDDVQAGYYNIPREVLEAYHIGPQDVCSDAYRAWVESRVLLARENFEAGRGYLARVQNPRCRLAGFAYTARFEWLLDTIEREGYSLRHQYNERKSVESGLRMSWLMLSSMINLRGAGTLHRPVVSHTQGNL